ncbi:hypothetical protein WR25_22663 isoform B [Diploscapter pachys]|uniref:COP9 signalosome complex subunit 3 N-terminal helical repeats domain-containing protein n=1 Tax=Diploscapter pachys TaxID=2018661 RepID=A0A2A2L252_9BILA|nr:hypothetical protein WR25_22663 isoform B [Diploscapter pachys]
MEALAKSINELSGLTEKEVGERCVDLVRKTKETMEKKQADAEPFLLSIANSPAATAAIISMIKVMFDGAFSKSHEVTIDRAVELLNHYLDERKLNPTHLKMIPDIFYPLIRCAGFYCLTKKNAPAIGFQIVYSALQLMQPLPGEPNQISSAHCALFALALKCGKFEEALPFIYDANYVICNESGKPIVNTADHMACVWCTAGADCGIPLQILNQIAEANATAQAASPDESQNGASQNPQASGAASAEEPSTSHSKMGGGGSGVPFLPKHSKWIVNQAISVPPSSCFDSKHLLLYLYYGALIKIKTNDYMSALILLENAILVPGNVVSQIQLDAYKKFIIVALLVFGEVPTIHEKSSTFIRTWKGKAGPYDALSQLQFSRAGRMAEKVATIINLKEQIFQKTFETTTLINLCQRANLKNVDELVKILKELCQEGSLKMELDQNSGTIKLNPTQEKVAEHKMKANIERMTTMKNEIKRLDLACQVGEI